MTNQVALLLCAALAIGCSGGDDEVEVDPYAEERAVARRSIIEHQRVCQTNVRAMQSDLGELNVRLMQSVGDQAEPLERYQALHAQKSHDAAAEAAALAEIERINAEVEVMHARQTQLEGQIAVMRAECDAITIPAP